MQSSTPTVNIVTCKIVFRDRTSHGNVQRTLGKPVLYLTGSEKMSGVLTVFKSSLNCTLSF